MNVFEQIKETLEEYIENAKAEGDYTYIEPFEIVKRAVNQIEKEHNNGWIACKDRLPEENQKVICSLDNGAVIILDYYGGAFCGVFKYDTNEVIAWQPLHLPPAYKESEEE